MVGLVDWMLGKDKVTWRPRGRRKCEESAEVAVKVAPFDTEIEPIPKEVLPPVLPPEVLPEVPPKGLVEEVVVEVPESPVDIERKF